MIDQLGKHVPIFFFGDDFAAVFQTDGIGAGFGISELVILIPFETHSIGFIHPGLRRDIAGINAAGKE